jgi:Mrp family chromosome partitioning ATPase
MREPTLFRFLNIENIQYDISSYLRGESSIDKIIYPTHYSNLHIIPTKEKPSNPSELILSSSLPKLIKELKKRYDYIIINSTPFGVIADTKHLMKLSDINLILFRGGYSEKSFIPKLNNLIKRDLIENIGIVYIESKKL